jgi:hypothetical protein
MILPPASLAVLTASGALATDVRLGCTHMYPVAFRTHAYLKHASWERVPVLPEAEPQRLAAALATVLLSSCAS